LLRAQRLHLNITGSFLGAVIWQHLKRAPIFPPLPDELEGTWKAHEDEKDEHALQCVDDVEECARRLGVERNYFENPIKRHYYSQEGRALHAAIKLTRTL
jgi:hypothetical protein